MSDAFEFLAQLLDQLSQVEEAGGKGLLFGPGAEALLLMAPTLRSKAQALQAARARLEDEAWRLVDEIRTILQADSASIARASSLSRPGPRSAQFYEDLAEDARMLASRLQDEAARSVILDVARVFARIAARLRRQEGQA